MFQVCFEYDEPSGKWEVFVRGATSSLEALQGLNAALITASMAIPRVEANRTTAMPDGSYHITFGQIG